MSFANLSISTVGSEALNALLPVGNRAGIAVAPAALAEPSDFMKLIESLIGREVATPPPTQVQGQENSVIPTGKNQEACIGDKKESAKGQTSPKDQKNPKDPQESNDPQPRGLVAMMTAAAPSAPAKPPLSLNFGRADGEDTYVKSSEPEVEDRIQYVPEAPAAKPQPEMPVARAPICAQASASIPISLPAPALTSETKPDIKVAGPISKEPEADPEPATLTPVPQAPLTSVPTPVTLALTGTTPLAPLPVPKDTLSKDRLPAPQQLRARQELTADSSGTPTLPTAIGKIRTERQASPDPMAFAARLTEREEPAVEQLAKPASPQGSKAQASPGQSAPAEPAVQATPQAEIVPANPKQSPHSAPPAPADPANYKTKPIAPERPVENVPANPKSPAAFTAPTREVTGAAAAAAPRAAVPPEVKEASRAHDTELQTKPTIRSEPAREISIRIPSGDNGNVDVQIVERNGKVQVTVRGTDAQLNSALRGELTELVHTLDQKGYKTETWTPNDTYPLTSSGAPEVRSTGRGESSPDWSGNPRNDGGQGGGSSGNQQQRHQQQDRPDWLIELERRLEREG